MVITMIHKNLHLGNCFEPPYDFLPIHTIISDAFLSDISNFRVRNLSFQFPGLESHGQAICFRKVKRQKEKKIENQSGSARVFTFSI